MKLMPGMWIMVMNPIWKIIWILPKLSQFYHRWEHIQTKLLISKEKKRAGDGTRTRYLNLGKVTLYQMSYARNRDYLI